ILLGLSFPANPGWQDLLLPAIFSFLTGVIVILPAPNIKAILINTNPPEYRGSVFAVHNLTDSIGRGFGPALGGALIVTMGYQFTMYFSVLTWIPCGIIYFLMYFTINNDLSRLKKYLKERRDKMLKIKEVNNDGSQAF
ncbi:MAG: MFS transporter, partial [bacterium]